MFLCEVQHLWIGFLLIYLFVFHQNDQGYLCKSRPFISFKSCSQSCKKKNHQARLSLVKINMVIGCTVLRSFRPHLKNIQNWLKMLHVLTPGKKISLIRKKLDGYNKIIGLNLNAQKINVIINFLWDSGSKADIKEENF